MPNLSFWPALLWCWGGWALLFWFICLGKDSLAVLRRLSIWIGAFSPAILFLGAVRLSVACAKR